MATSTTWGACSSPISRVNNGANQVLTSAKYNLDLNTAYTKINDLDGDCITDATIATAKLEDLSVTEEKIALAVIARFIPVGSVLAYTGTVAPSGYLLCDGTAVNRTTYSALFAVIGETHGEGNGSTTFNVPDYRGRFLRGVDGGVGRDPDRASRTAMNTGGNAGDQVGSVQTDALAAHTHTIPLYDGGARTANLIANANNTSNFPTVAESATSDSTGGNETRPENAGVNWIIKI